MNRCALYPVAVTVLLCAGAGAAWAVEGAPARCFSSADPEGQLERVPDCIRMGRHVRVESSISRGTAALDEGVTPTALPSENGRDPASPRRRVRVPAGPGGSLWSGFFGR